MAAKIVRNLSVKTIGVNPKKVSVSDDPNARAYLGTILGAVTNILTDERPDGTIYDVMRGQFECTNCDGEVYRSGRCFLPVGFDEPIIGAIKKAEAVHAEELKKGNADAPPVPTIKFAVKLFAIKAGNPQGYSYEMEPLVEKSESSQTDLLADIRAEVLALPAPTEPGNVEPEQAQATANVSAKADKTSGKKAA